MDQIRKKKKKARDEKKVLLSIVDPWDVKVASVDPVGLAARRGASLSILSSAQDEGNASQEWPSRTVKIPSPWYKPGSGSTGHVSSAKFGETVLIDTNFLHPWYKAPSSPVSKRKSSSLSPSRERLRDSGRRSKEGNKTERDAEADEVDGGLINGTQEIRRDDSDDADGTAAARVRFEIGRARPQRNGVRCENEQSVNDTPRVLIESPSGNGNSKSEHATPAITGQSRANGVTVEKRESSQKTGNVTGENSVPQVVKDPVVNIVQHLVESRYNPQTAADNRSKRMPSCRRQEASKEIYPVDISGELNDNANGIINIVKQESHQQATDETKVPKASPNAVGLRATNIRKTSISMPSKLDEMDVLRIDRQNIRTN